MKPFIRLLTLCIAPASLFGCLGTVSKPASAACTYSTKSPGTLGNIPYPAGGPYSGVTFRVWSPSATAVSAAGAFNSWGHTPLCKETPGGVWNEYWSVDIPGATTGQQYQYSITANGSTSNFRDPHARLVNQAAQIGGNSITYDPSKYSWTNKSPTSVHGLNTLVIYEMHIGTFNVPSGSSYGTFQSAIQQLPHIQNLGFNAIELIPVTQFDGVQTNPYNPTDPYAVDNDEYGGPDNLKAFINAAHADGIAVILDVVHSFWNATHDSSVYDWENSDSSNYPDGEYFYELPYTYGGFGSRPDYSSSYIGGSSGYIADEMAMWVNEYHVDGFRWDSIGNIYNTCNGGETGDCDGYSPQSLPAGITLMQDINSTDSKLFLIAEDATASSQQADDTLPISSCGSCLGFNTQWNPTLAYYFETAMPGTGAFPTNDLAVSMLSSYYWWNGTGLHDTNYVQSHNELSPGAPNSNGYRLIELIDNNTSGNPPSLTAIKKTTLAAGILFTTPGVPMVYQGDEFFDYSRFDFKTALDWNNENTYPGIETLYQHLIAARVNYLTNTPGLSDPNDDVFLNDTTNSVVAWDRYNSAAPCTDDVVVVANLNSANTASNYSFGLPCAGTWHVVFNGDSQSYYSSFGGIGPTEGSTLTAESTPLDGYNYSTSLQIGKFSLIILSLN